MEHSLDIIFYEAFEEEAEAIRRYLPDTIRAEFTALTPQEAKDQALRATVVSTRTQSVIPDEWAHQLRGILTRSTGYDHVISYRNRTGTKAETGYLPLYCNRAVAEQAMLMWMCLLRKLPRQLNHFGTFHRDGITGRECRDRTLLVTGIGNIGGEIVDIGRGLGMEVIGVDPVRKRDDLHYMSFAEGLPRADIVVCSMNLTAENRHFFNLKTLQNAKPGLIFVNIARGELANAADLLAMLRSGRLSGVGLDVYEHEPDLAVALRGGQTPSNPTTQAVLELTCRDDVICTPHNAFNTQESVDRKASQSVEQIETFLATGNFKWSVPPE